MSTKTISITDEAYDILKSRKNENESFSETIVRLSGKELLASFYGALSKHTGDSLAQEIASTRKKHREIHERRIK